MSSDWENDIAKAIWHSNPQYIRSYTAGYSGNNAFPQPDIHIVDNSTGMAHDLELKGPIASETVIIEEEDDLEQLLDCRSVHTRVWLVIKFQNRRPFVVPYLETDETEDMDSVAEEFAYIINEMNSSFNARVSTSDKTGITRLYVDKPPIDNDGKEGWPSARSGEDDHREILRAMGIYRVGKGK